MAAYEVVKVFNLAAAPADIQAVNALQVLKGSDVSPRSLLEVRVGHNTTVLGGHVRLLLDQWMLDEGAEVGETVLLVWNAAMMATSAREAQFDR